MRYTENDYVKEFGHTDCKSLKDYLTRVYNFKDVDYITSGDFDADYNLINYWSKLNNVTKDEMLLALVNYFNSPIEINVDIIKDDPELTSSVDEYEVRFDYKVKFDKYYLDDFSYFTFNRE